MIKSFRHKGLEKFYRTGSKAGIQPKHALTLQEQLTVLDNATKPEDVNVPTWGFHSLKGELAGHFAIWVNKNWRMTFTFEGEDAVLVDYQDYHEGGTFMAMHNPAHPGRILARYIHGNELTVAQAADYLGVTRPTLSRVLHGHAAISAEMAIRIGKTFHTDPGLWVRMQGQYDLWRASRHAVKARPLERVSAIDAGKTPLAAQPRSSRPVNS